MRIRGESGSPPEPGLGWHNHGFFHGFVYNCCTTISSCLYFVCCCWLIQDCLRGVSDRFGPPPPPPPIPHGPPGGPGPIGPSASAFAYPGPPSQPAPPGPRGSLLERPLL